MNQVDSDTFLYLQTVWIEIERALFAYFKSYTDSEGYKFVGRLPGSHRPMILRDLAERQISVDALILDETLRPLALIDFPGFVDGAVNLIQSHTSLKQKYLSIKGSLVLAVDTWSQDSIDRLKAADIDLLLIPWVHIVDLLVHHHITMDASVAQNPFADLPPETLKKIGDGLLAIIKPQLQTWLTNRIVRPIESEITRITVELHSSQGQLIRRAFTHLPDAIHFLHLAGDNYTELW